MEDIVVTQQSLLSQLNVIKRNYDKTPIARRTTGYVSGKIKAIDDIWESIQANDVEIQAFKEFNESKYLSDIFLKTLSKNFHC